MAGIKVHINKKTVDAALKQGGGPLQRWREETAEDIMFEFNRRVEDNLESNALHRGGVTGGYRRGANIANYGTGSGYGFRFQNDADHAVYAELGRGPSAAWQFFSWSRKKGRMAWYSETRGRDGQHAMRDSINVAMPRHVDGYTPLP